MLAQADRGHPVEPAFARSLTVIALLDANRQAAAQVARVSHLFARNVIADHVTAVLEGGEMGESAEAASSSSTLMPGASPSLRQIR